MSGRRATMVPASAERTDCLPAENWERVDVWAWAAAETSYPHGVRDLDGRGLKALVGERVNGWAAGLSTLIDATDPGTVALVPLRTMPHLPDWAASRVTLLATPSTT